VVLIALNDGTIPGGSTIDIVYSAPITNNSTASVNNISLANNISCIPSNSCSSEAALISNNIVRLSFSDSTSFGIGTQIDVSRVRVNANAAALVGLVTANFGALSANSATNPITFTDPQRLVGVLSPTITADFNHSTATPNPVTTFFTCSFANDAVDDFFIRVSEAFFPGTLTTTLQEYFIASNLAPTNRPNLTITITNVPAGMTLSATGTQLSTGILSMSVPVPSDTVVQTVNGAPISFSYAVSNADASQVEQTTFNFSLRPTSGGSIPDVQSPITIHGTVQIAPITPDDSTIVRFVENQIGPTPLATISNCPPPRPKRPQLISE
jgi:hypothetical protein